MSDEQRTAEDERPERDDTEGHMPAKYSASDQPAPDEPETEGHGRKFPTVGEPAPDEQDTEGHTKLVR